MKREILREINGIARIISAMREKEFSKYELKRGQHTFLTRVVENPGISQKELSNLLKVGKGTTAKAIKKLIEEGYAVKERSKLNYKVFEVYPTTKGKELYPKLLKEIIRTGEVALKKCEDEIIYNELRKIRENLEAEWERF